MVEARPTTSKRGSSAAPDANGAETKTDTKDSGKIASSSSEESKSARADDEKEKKASSSSKDDKDSSRSKSKAEGTTSTRRKFQSLVNRAKGALKKPSKQDVDEPPRDGEHQMEAASNASAGANGASAAIGADLGVTAAVGSAVSSRYADAAAVADDRILSVGATSADDVLPQGLEGMSRFLGYALRTAPQRSADTPALVPYCTIPVYQHVGNSALSLCFYRLYIIGRGFALWRVGTTSAKLERLRDSYDEEFSQKKLSLDQEKVELRKKLRLQSRRSVATFINVRDFMLLRNVLFAWCRLSLPKPEMMRLAVRQLHGQRRANYYAKVRNVDRELLRHVFHLWVEAGPHELRMREIKMKFSDHWELVNLQNRKRQAWNSWIVAFQSARVIHTAWHNGNKCVKMGMDFVERDLWPAAVFFAWAKCVTAENRGKERKQAQEQLDYERELKDSMLARVTKITHQVNSDVQERASMNEAFQRWLQRVYLRRHGRERRGTNRNLFFKFGKFFLLPEGPPKPEEKLRSNAYFDMMSEAEEDEENKPPEGTVDEPDSPVNQGAPTPDADGSALPAKTAGAGSFSVTGRLEDLSERQQQNYEKLYFRAWWDFARKSRESWIYQEAAVTACQVDSLKQIVLDEVDVTSERTVKLCFYFWALETKRHFRRRLHSWMSLRDSFLDDMALIKTELVQKMCWKAWSLSAAQTRQLRTVQKLERRTRNVAAGVRGAGVFEKRVSFYGWRNLVLAKIARNRVIRAFVSSTLLNDAPEAASEAESAAAGVPPHSSMSEAEAATAAKAGAAAEGEGAADESGATAAAAVVEGAVAVDEHAAPVDEAARPPTEQEAPPQKAPSKQEGPPEPAAWTENLHIKNKIFLGWRDWGKGRLEKVRRREGLRHQLYQSQRALSEFFAYWRISGRERADLSASDRFLI